MAKISGNPKRTPVSPYARRTPGSPWILLKDRLTETQFEWDTRTVADGMHSLVVRATDSQGGTGDSLPVSVAVSNQSGCGCSARGGGWESLGLLALAAAIRRRRS